MFSRFKPFSLLNLIPTRNQAERASPSEQHGPIANMTDDQHTSVSLEDLVNLFRELVDVRYEIRRTDTENKTWGEKKALQDELRDLYAPATRTVNETSERARHFFELEVPRVQTRVMPDFLPGLEERLADFSMARDRFTPYETQLRQARLLSRAE